MCMGLQSSAYERVSTAAGTPIALNTQIFAADIVVTREMLGRSDSGLFRIWWSFGTAAAADYELTVTKLGFADLLGSPLKVNGDNTFVLRSDGYYRFDIGVKPGDLINLSSNVQIDAVNDLQVQQIQIGA